RRISIGSAHSDLADRPIVRPLYRGFAVPILPALQFHSHSSASVRHRYGFLTWSELLFLCSANLNNTSFRRLVGVNNYPMGRKFLIFIPFVLLSFGEVPMKKVKVSN